MSATCSCQGAPPVRRGRRPELPRLTVLRGLGALVVLVGHVALLHPLRDHHLNVQVDRFLEPLGVAGVSGFFVLSGFVLTWTADRRVGAGAFWRRRLARLYPVHAATWTIAMLVGAAAGISGALWKMLPSLALVNVWVPQLEIFWGPNTPSWTLSVEAFFYLLFPLLLPIAWRLPARHLHRALWGVAALIVLWAVLVSQLVPAGHLVTETGTAYSRIQYFAIVVCPPARLLDFVLGILLARTVIAGQLPSGLRPVVYGSLIAGYAAVRWVLPAPFGFVAAMVPAIIIGVLYSAKADLEGTPSRWAVRPLIWAGEVSFPLYMVHWSVVYGGYHLIGQPTWTPLEALIACLVMVGISLALAHLLRTRIEIPMYARFRSATRPAAQLPGPTAATPAAATTPARPQHPSPEPQQGVDPHADAAGRDATPTPPGFSASQRR
ncbi:MAG: acyltransferase [Patulibacter sp.]